jgi:hypothetical protein
MLNPSALAMEIKERTLVGSSGSTAHNPAIARVVSAGMRRTFGRVH